MIKTVQKAILHCRRLRVLTGAGISAESGVPTFRGASGLWGKYNVMELATPEAFQRNPELVWKFYNWRREVIAKVKPNPAHKALVDLEKIIPDFLLITQNVDGLHQQAGNKNMVELHGNIWWVKCTTCKYLDENRQISLPPLPICPKCGGLLRPNVVWFGEALDPEVLDKAIKAMENTDVLLVIGTSAVVQPAASLIWLAKEHGALIIEINIERTEASEIADITLLEKAAEILPQLVKSLR